MNAENVCAKIGCPAACCRNIELPLSCAEADRFIEGQRVNYINPQNLEVFNLDEIPSIPNGINIVGDPQNSEPTVHVYLKGFCPYLDQSSMNCTIYTQKKRPSVCSEVEIGHPTCNSQRTRIGLALVKPLARV